MEPRKYLAFRKKGAPKKSWITDKMLDKMDERRKWKNINTEEGKRMYKSLHKELRIETEKARHVWWDARCDQLIEYDKRGRSDLLYYDASRLTGTRKRSDTRSFEINDRSGELLTKNEEMKMRWKEYIEELYDKSNKIGNFNLEDEGQVNCDEKGPDLLTDEIYASIAELKNGKAVGVDDIPA
jgi:hypothetical protein